MKVQKGAPRPSADATDDPRPARPASAPPASADLPPAAQASLLGARPRPAAPGGILTRLGSMKAPVYGALLGAMLFTTPFPAQAQSRDAPPPPREVVAAQIGRVAQTGAPIAEVAADAVASMQVEAVARLEPARLFDRAEEGLLQVQVPLRPGRYDVGGTAVTVDPGTVVYATVQIEDGRLVPYDDGDGTRVQLTKPLDGPVWTTARGLYLQDRGGGTGRAVVDVDGWFDKALGGTVDLQVSDVIGRLTANIPDDASAADLPMEMVDWENLRFRLEPLRFDDGVVDLGGVVLDLAEGNDLSIVGTADEARIEGRFDLDAAQIRQPGLSLDLSDMQADLQLRSQRLPNGDVVLTGGLQNLSGHATRLVADHDGPGERGVQLDLRDVQLSDARIDVHTTIHGLDGRPELSSAQVRFRGEVDGRVAASTATLRDARGDTDLSFSADRVRGRVDVGGPTLGLAIQLEGSEVEIRDYQPVGTEAVVDLRHASFEGSARLELDTDAGLYLAQADATRLTATIDDLQADGEARLDLGRTEISGAGRLTMSPGAFRIEGDLGIAGRIDDLKVNADPDLRLPTASLLDVAAGSTVQGRLRTLAVSPDGPAVFDASARLDLGLENHAVEIPGLTASGGSQLEGEAHVQLRDGRLSLRGDDLVAMMTLTDGAVEDGNDVLSLDLARGSTLRLAIHEAGFGADEGAQLRLGAGSLLEARLDGGHLDIGGRRVAFEPGTLVRFDIASLERQPDGAGELVGSLLIDAPFDLAPLAGARNITGLVGDGGAGLRIDGVRLGADGRLALAGVDLAFEGTLGDVERLTPATGRARLTTLLSAHPEIRTNQDLINYFYRAGGDWGQASTAAAAYGLRLDALTAEREGPAVSWLSNAGGLQALDLNAATDVPTAEAVKGANAAEMLGLDPAVGVPDLAELAPSIVSGEVLFTVPIEGTYGTWPSSVTFAPGTHLVVRAEATDGEIDPESFSVRLTQYGDAAFWTTLDGAYLNEDNDLVLDIWGWADSEVEGFEALPMDIPGLITRLTTQMEGGGGGGDADGLAGLLDLSQANLRLSNLQFEDNRLPLPIGFVDLDESSRLTIDATPDRQMISGRFATDGLQIASPAFALETGSGTANLSLLRQVGEDGTARTRLTFSNLDLDGRGMMFRTDHGSMIHLGAGRAEGQVSFDIVDRDGEVASVSPRIRLDRFDGDVEGVRIALGEDGAWLTLDPARFDGWVHVDANGATRLQGHAEGLDGRLEDVVLTSPVGAVEIPQARLQGNGILAVDGADITFMGGGLRGTVDFDAPDLDVDNILPGYLQDIELDGTRARVTFDLEHVDEAGHVSGAPLVLHGARGRVQGHVQLDGLDADIEAKPFQRGLDEEGR